MALIKLGAPPTNGAILVKVFDSSTVLIKGLETDLNAFDMKIGTASLDEVAYPDVCVIMFMLSNAAYKVL